MWLLRDRLFATAAAAVVALLLTVQNVAFGQASDGHLVGIVYDQIGASIPGGFVEVENVNTGATWNQQTDELGAYRFSNLPVGACGEILCC